MSEPLAAVLPIYFVADESGSMSGVVGELNHGLRSLLDAMATETMAAAKIRFSVIGFSDTAVNRLAMSDLRFVEKMPTLGAYNTTSYVAAFKYLKQQIPADVAALRAAGNQVHRPAVFFLTDGLPNEEDWPSALRELTDSGFREHPNILAFGIGNADPETIVKVATSKDFAYQAAEGADTGRAIAKFCESLTRSIVNSGNALAGGKAELVGERPEGFRLAADLLT